MPKPIIDLINGKIIGLPVGDANGIAGLDSGGLLPIAQLPAAVAGAVSYQGTWDASTNTPTLASGVGTKGYYYSVSVSGSTNLDGITDWVKSGSMGDFAIYNGTAWEKIDNTETTFTFVDLTPTETELNYVAGVTSAIQTQFSNKQPLFVISTKTAAYTVLSSDYTILADMTAGAYTITLPATPTSGIIINIKKVTSDTNTLTIGRNGKNIEGSAADLTTAATNFPNFTLQYFEGSGWWIL